MTAGGIDTNVLVRYLVQDDAGQFEQARRFIETICCVDAPGLIHPVALCELVWVLRSVYGVPREEIADVLDLLLRIRSLRVSQVDQVRAAIDLYRTTPVDFADALLHVTYRAAGAVGLVTFDRRAGTLPGAVLLESA